MPFHILTPKSCLTYLYLLCLNTLISMLHSPEQMGTDQDRYYNGQIIRCRLRINNAFHKIPKNGADNCSAITIWIP